MILDGEPPISMPSPERLSVTVTFQCMTFKKVLLLTVLGLVYLLTSKFNKFIFVLD